MGQKLGMKDSINKILTPEEAAVNNGSVILEFKKLRRVCTFTFVIII